MKILIVLRNIGPYHNSRFESLVKINLKVSVFETRPDSKEYLWCTSENYKYDVFKFPISLFPDKDITNKKIDSFYRKYIPLIKPDVIVSIGWADRTYQRLLLYGNVNKIPLSVKTKKILNDKNNFRLEDLLNSGDDYELIIISSQKNRNKIFNIAKKNNINVTFIGKIISEKGIHFDSHLDMKNIKKFDHFS